LIEVMDVVVGNNNVSLHTQPSTEEQVRGDDCHADVDSVSSIENTDDVDVHANADVDDSNLIVSTNGITCNVASVAKLSKGGKVKEKQQLCLSCSVGLKKSSGTCHKLETISPCEFPDWTHLHWLKTGCIFYVSCKGFIWPCAECNPIGKKK